MSLASIRVSSKCTGVQARKRQECGRFRLVDRLVSRDLYDPERHQA